MYIRLSDAHYPMAEAEIRAENPDTSFSTPFNPDGYDWVFSVPQPAYNAITQTVREISPVLDSAKLTWGQAWEVVDRYATQAETDAAVASQCTLVCLSRCAEIEVLYSAKIFTDVTVTFPSGNKVIQFRDNSDRANLESVCAGATALVALGQGDTQMIYRTLDDDNQVVTAAQMTAIGLGVLSAKQAITDKRWFHKDALHAIEIDATKTSEQKLIDIAGYDIQVGW